MKIKLFIGLLVPSVLFVSAFLYKDVFAIVSGTCFFSGASCSAGDTGDPWGHYGIEDVFSGRDELGNGQAIDSSVNSPAVFIDFVEGRLGGGAQDKTGAEFTIAQLIGKTTRPTAADLTDFEARMSQPGITVEQVLAYPEKTSWYDYTNDDDFYDEHPAQPRTVVEIRFYGVVYAQIETLCGNMVADALPLPVPTPTPTPTPTPPATPNACRPIRVTIQPHRGYDDDGGTYYPPIEVTAVNRTTGDIIDDLATVRRNPVTYDLTTDCTTGDVWDIYIDIDGHYNGRDRDCDTDAGGNRDCGPWYGTNYSDPSNRVSTSVGPCYDYLLNTAIVKRYDSYQAEVNSMIYVKPLLESDSWTKYFYNYSPLYFWDTYQTHTKNKPAEWQVTELVYNNGVIPTNESDYIPSNNNPCTYYHPDRCIILKSGQNTVFDFLYGIDPSVTNPVQSGPSPWANTDDYYIPVTIGDYAAGTKICFVFSVRERASDDSRWDHSALYSPDKCIVVVKKPKVQVWGGDLSVGKSFTSTPNDYKSVVATTTSDKVFNNGPITRFGSWSEYGIFANGTIIGMASGSAFSGTGLVNSTVCKYNTLSFVNVPSGGTSCTGDIGTIGNYTNTQTIPNVAKAFPVISTTPHLSSISNYNGLQGVYTASGNITIGGGNIKKGQWIVINAPTANVTISGNINYTNGTLKGINEIPQMVIIANNIIINDSVTNVDAWLVASGNSGIIKTCSSGAGNNYGEYALTTNICSMPLVVNGPVMAKELWLYRTGGSGVGANNSGDPAETFNLRADAYLWSYARATGSGRVQTVYTTEMPPRL